MVLQSLQANIFNFKKGSIFIMKKFKRIAFVGILGTLLLAAASCKDNNSLGTSFDKQSEIGEQAQIDENIKDYETIKNDTDTNDDENNTQAKDNEAPVVPSHLNDVQGIVNDINNAKNDDIIEINEKVFITQINDIFFNFEDYKDKTIVVEGMYSIFESEISDIKMPVVYRNGPGCCSNDAWAGFLLKYNGELPKENDWIRVTGKPELEHTKEGYTNLYLNVDKIKILKERGKEDVLQ